MLKVVLIVLGALVALAALVLIIGASLPKGHSASVSARFRQPPEAIWAAITDAGSQTSWRADLSRVERLPDKNGLPVHKEIGRQGEMTLETIESVPPRRLVQRIADTGLPFGGTWTWEITPASDGCLLTVREDGEIYNPLFRFMARFVFGYEGSLRGYLKALEKKFGD